MCAYMCTYRYIDIVLEVTYYNDILKLLRNIKEKNDTRALL